LQRSIEPAATSGPWWGSISNFRFTPKADSI
jgi:hypothetical protein